MTTNEIILGLIGAGAKIIAVSAENMTFSVMVDDHRIDLRGTRARDAWQIVTEFFELSGSDPVELYEKARDAIQDIDQLNREKDAQFLEIINSVRESKSKIK